MDTTGKACLAECLDENAWAACVFAEREYLVSVDDDMPPPEPRTRLYAVANHLFQIADRLWIGSEPCRIDSVRSSYLTPALS
jgi:hypothetical protein